MVHGPIGFVHLMTAILALVTGTLVLINKKGTKKHRQVGYVYFVSMLLMNLTAFALYNLFGSWGIFHWAAVVSFLTVIGGVRVAVRRKPGWIYPHLAWMYWSVIGLYAAFFSEVFTRIPSTPFFGMVGVATATTMIIGSFVFRRHKKKWAKMI